jgi:hypothetical protein
MKKVMTDEVVKRVFDALKAGEKTASELLFAESELTLAHACSFIRVNKGRTLEEFKGALTAFTRDFEAMQS